MLWREKAVSECYALGDGQTLAVKEEIAVDSITLKNFRCFREEQTARLAPLTLLVGENSTGKTSFMAMIRALCDVLYGGRAPDFKEEPYDLGSFDEIAHYRGGKGGRADSFGAGFQATFETVQKRRRRSKDKGQTYRFDATFEKNGSAPVLGKAHLERKDVWIEISRKNQSWETSFGTSNGAWRVSKTSLIHLGADQDSLPFFHSFLWRLGLGSFELKKGAERIASRGPKQPTTNDLERIEQLAEIPGRIGFYFAGEQPYTSERPYAGAPVRSRPRRTYDPARPTPDPEGDYIPMYLAHLSHHDPDKWKRLKKALEDFGKEAGLFDEIYIRHLGKRDSEPFQVQVRKSGTRAKSPKGPRRNLIDVGYGVSQVLPVITELLQEDASPMFLLQQPEVHLHPSAQAALGSLFCRVAGPERQLLVETHGDHLLSRVRMDVRDGASDLKPEDVSILFFERDDLDVRIHSIGLDEEGNVRGAPATYRKFFMEETRRSLWKR